MPIENGVYTPLTSNEALTAIFESAPSSIVFSPGNPPELVLANMFARANVSSDEFNGRILASLMSPIGATIDLLNPNNPRRSAVAAHGYIKISNATQTPETIPPGTVCTSGAGLTYTTGATSIIVDAQDDAYAVITSDEVGIGGNIPAGQDFTISGFGTLTAENTLPFLNGTVLESDALYLNRLTSERSEYGSQSGSVAVETEIKKYYPAARMYVNNSDNPLADPVPVPVNGYNLVVMAPGGVLTSVEDIAQIFTILSERLEFVNAQTTGDALHEVFSGTILTSEIPQIYYCTVAQPVATTITAEINIRASGNVDRTEVISQANSFALAFVNRLVAMFAGVDGKMDVTYHDGNGQDVITTIDVTGSATFANALAPAFGVEAIAALVFENDTPENLPHILFDSVDALEIVIDPEVQGESAMTLELGGGTTFIDFKNDALFSDDTSWFDRYLYIDPVNVTITVNVI